jgi:hypothetical protein
MSGADTSSHMVQGNEHALRYLSLHDNQYIRYFRGHTARVSALAMSPKNDLFMSAAEVRPHSRCLGTACGQGYVASVFGDRDPNAPGGSLQ